MSLMKPDKNEMGKTKQKKLDNPSYIYCLIVGAIIELASVYFIGWDVLFLYGLVLGTAVAIVNYKLLVFFSRLALSSKRGVGLVVIGYIARLSIYGGIFYLSYRSGLTSGVGTLLGYITLKVVIFYEYGFRPGMASKKYDKTRLKNLDKDLWALEKAEKAEKPKKFWR